MKQGGQKAEVVLTLQQPMEAKQNPSLEMPRGYKIKTKDNQSETARWSFPKEGNQLPLL